MNKKNVWIGFLSILILQACSFGTSDKQDKITFGTLLEEMTNRETLSYLQAENWSQHQASSYQRLSLSPEDTAGWFANNDWNHFQGKEIINGRTEFVMLDVDGPGVITRFWTGGNPSLLASLRFYIDGDTVASWEAGQAGELIGENKMIGYPLSALSVSKDQALPKPSQKLGHNLYAPLPFSKHIKITYEGPDPRPGAGDGMFYNINYRLYKGDVKMESLNKETVVKYAEQLKQANTKLATLIDELPGEVKVQEEKNVKSTEFNLKKGESGGAVQIEGASSIRRILISLSCDSLDQAVKDLTIQMSFDGNQTVDVPIGFFFGCGDQLVPVSDWYRKVDTLGNMSCYWVMPFQTNAEVKIVNHGERNVVVNMDVATGDYNWNANSLYFHANYSELGNYPTVAKQGQDFNFITIPSAGNYVGDNLQMTKSIPGWWGEGDEKIYVDGSTFPDHFGTGTEDYYGYAWGGQYPNPFNHPFIGQPYGEGNSKIHGGTTVNSRVRALDAISFNKSLRFDLESWNWHGGDVDFAWACFWYAGSNVNANTTK
jgi:hypothetical protein